MAATLAAEITAALAGDAVAEAGTRAGFFAWVDGARPDGYRPNGAALDGSVPVTLRRSVPAVGPARPIRILTATMGAAVLAPHLGALSEHAGVEVTTLAVDNDFFGGNIGVTGLLTGADLAAALADAPNDARYLLPDVTLSRGRFLDGTTLDDLPRPVEVVTTSGVGLVAALRPQERSAA
jgi:hypothetical protein